MSNDNHKTLQVFEECVGRLIDDHDAIRKKNISLLQTLDQRNTTVAELKAKVKKLETDYANLKIAKMMEVSDDDIKDAKLKITRLVHKVDKCIALLNV